jgi:hypothetical protein
MALDLGELQAEVARNRSVDGSAAALIRGIAQRIQDAIAADDVTDATNLNALVTDLRSSSDDLSAAVTENTPQAPGGETGGGEGGQPPPEGGATA